MQNSTTSCTGIIREVVAHRSFLKLLDFEPEELTALLGLAATLPFAWRKLRSS